MKTLKTLTREMKSLSKYVKREMPREVSKAWLWASQNAFLTETDPKTGIKWQDRYGIAYGKGLKKVGNVEQHLSYSKQHRKGKLLSGLSSKAVGNEITLSNRVKYAKDHEEGVAVSKVVRIKPPYTRGGASTVITGGNITERPSMNPSKKILVMPKTLIGRKMRSYGW